MRSIYFNKLCYEISIHKTSVNCRYHIVTPRSCAPPIYPAVATHWAIRSVAAKICHISPATRHTLSDNISWRVRDSSMMEDQDEQYDVPVLICSTPQTGIYLSDLVCTDQIGWKWPIRSGMRQMKSAALLATNYSDYICTLMITSKPESMVIPKFFSDNFIIWA